MTADGRNAGRLAARVALLLVPLALAAVLA
jgi:hypothetical protein